MDLGSEGDHHADVIDPYREPQGARELQLGAAAWDSAQQQRGLVGVDGAPVTMGDGAFLEGGSSTLEPAWMDEARERELFEVEAADDDQWADADANEQGDAGADDGSPLTAKEECELALLEERARERARC